MTENIVTKSAVSVSDQSKMVALSRARFYQLVRAGVFPAPDHDPLTKRPFYSEESQRICLEVRRRNRGMNGQPILFYARRRDLGQQKAVKRAARPKTNDHQYLDLIDLLSQAKLVVTAAQVEAVVKQEFPQGTEGLDPSEVFVTVLNRIRGQNSSGSDRR